MLSPLSGRREVLCGWWVLPALANKQIMQWQEERAVSYGVCGSHAADMGMACQNSSHSSCCDFPTNRSWDRGELLMEQDKTHVFPQVLAPYCI